MNNMKKFYWLVIAGLLGGLTEVIWVGLYSTVQPLSLSGLGSAITATVITAGDTLPQSHLLGLGINMLLSVGLALGFGYILWPMISRLAQHKLNPIPITVITLAIVWKVNFFLLLPVWNPAFISMLPPEISLMSKLLFGVAMGAVLVSYQKRVAF